MKFLFLPILYFSSAALANPTVSEECTPRTEVITGSSFSGIVQMPSSIECGLEILKASAADYILINSSLGGISVTQAKKGTHRSGDRLFYVWDIATIKEAVDLFCDVSLPVETLDEDSVDFSVFCTPLK